ncbi:DarT ssDNA thymidine ADP-ribosyltransferase family protein [Campylobacter hyointestinalis]|nr:DarT ssDNA thymidine ADP-ribosyltransferase family protein [Campylobacter hyointestinalis]
MGGGKSRNIFISLLKKNNIKEIYHISPLKNLASINNCGALLCKSMLQSKNIDVEFATNDLSWNLDNNKGLDDFIHFSFNLPKNNPNLNAFLYRNPNTTFAMFAMNVNVLTNFDNVYFTNINSTSNNAKIFNDFDNFNNLDFDIFRKNYSYPFPQDLKPYLQAEILIPNKINIKNLKLKKLLRYNKD